MYNKSSFYFKIFRGSIVSIWLRSISVLESIIVFPAVKQLLKFPKRVCIYLLYKIEV